MGRNQGIPGRPAACNVGTAGRPPQLGGRQPYHPPVLLVPAAGEIPLLFQQLDRRGQRPRGDPPGSRDGGRAVIQAAVHRTAHGFQQPGLLRGQVATRQKSRLRPLKAVQQLGYKAIEGLFALLHVIPSYAVKHYTRTAAKVKIL